MWPIACNATVVSGSYAMKKNTLLAPTNAAAALLT